MSVRPLSWSTIGNLKYMLFFLILMLRGAESEIYKHYYVPNIGNSQSQYFFCKSTVFWNRLWIFRRCKNRVNRMSDGKIMIGQSPAKLDKKYINITFPKFSQLHDWFKAFYLTFYRLFRLCRCWNMKTNTQIKLIRNRFLLVIWMCKRTFS